MDMWCPMDDERILVIDDDPQVLAMIENFLRRSGYVVETVSDGQAALKRLRIEASREGCELALVLCDLKMQDMDGLRILEEVKELCPDAVFCLVTGHATIDSAVAALRNGVYDYLTKPLDLDDLLSTVQRALEHRALITQNKRLIEFLREKNVTLGFLHREEQRKAEQLRQVNAIARQITPILDVETLVLSVLELIEPAFDFVAPSFGLIEGRELYFRGGRLDGLRVKADESVFWRLTNGGRLPFVRLSSDVAVGGGKAGTWPRPVVAVRSAGRVRIRPSSVTIAQPFFPTLGIQSVSIALGGNSSRRCIALISRTFRIWTILGEKLLSKKYVMPPGEAVPRILLLALRPAPARHTTLR